LVTATAAGAELRADTVAIAALARELSSDDMRGRGPWSRDAERAARRLAGILEQLGARPVFGDRLLVPFAVPERSRDTVFNVVGVLPARDRSVTGELIGIGSHLDHLGVGPPDARGDSIYNGFLDAAVPMAMTLDVARRYARQPGDRALVVMFFNLEEQGLLGSKALLARADAQAFVARLRLFVGVDAGSPAGEAVVWQLMGGSPTHAGARLADSLARARVDDDVDTAAPDQRRLHLLATRRADSLPHPRRDMEGVLTGTAGRGDAPLRSLSSAVRRMAL